MLSDKEGASLTDPAPFPPDILDSIDSAELRELKALHQCGSFHKQNGMSCSRNSIKGVL